jgi:hypothetical protein
MWVYHKPNSISFKQTQTAFMKPMLTIAVLLLYFISCTKENLNKPAVSSLQPANDLNQLDNFYIGQNYGGGIIFYIDSTGQHGLIVSAEEKQVTWWNGEYTLPMLLKLLLEPGISTPFEL